MKRKFNSSKKLKDYNPSAYSWLGVAPKPKRKQFTHDEIKRLEKDCGQMEQCNSYLTETIHHYHDLCRQYESKIGTAQGEEILKEMKVLKEEIEKSSMDIIHSLEDAADLTS